MEKGVDNSKTNNHLCSSFSPSLMEGGEKARNPGNMVFRQRVSLFSLRELSETRIHPPCGQI